jgi:hypothetical protein
MGFVLVRVISLVPGKILFCLPIASYPVVLSVILDLGRPIFPYVLLVALLALIDMTVSHHLVLVEL